MISGLRQKGTLYLTFRNLSKLSKIITFPLIVFIKDQDHRAFQGYEAGSLYCTGRFTERFKFYNQSISDGLKYVCYLFL